MQQWEVYYLRSSTSEVRHWNGNGVKHQYQDIPCPFAAHTSSWNLQWLERFYTIEPEFMYYAAFGSYSVEDDFTGTGQRTQALDDK